MPKRKGRNDPREEEAAMLLLLAPRLSSCMAMETVGFSEAESRNRALQQRILRLKKKLSTAYPPVNYVSPTTQSAYIPPWISVDSQSVGSSEVTMPEPLKEIYGASDFNDDRVETHEMIVVKGKIKAMEDIKKFRTQMEKYAKDGKQVLSKKKPIDKMTDSELEKLLLWHQIPKTEMGKSRSDKLMKWKQIVDNEMDLPPRCNRWCSEDEAELDELKEHLQSNMSRAWCTLDRIMMPTSVVLSRMNLDELQSLEHHVREERRKRTNKNVGVF